MKGLGRAIEGVATDTSKVELLEGLNSSHGSVCGSPLS
jgi:hypothetical protein